MKVTLTALAALMAIALTVPAFAMEPSAAAPQLAQSKDKDKKAEKAATPKASKDNDHTNKGGAARGDARSDQVGKTGK